LELPLARIGCDLEIFNILVENKAPLTVAQLAEKTKADPVLLGGSTLLKADMTFPNF
jgi:demethylsterigmatocystin 6-O-methyltransferase